MEMVIAFQTQLLSLVQMDGNQMDKEDVFHWQLLLQLKFHHQDVQIVLLLMEQEDAFQDQSCLQYHVQQVSWAMETEIAYLCQHQSQLSHQLLQVHAHAKEQSMNYNQKYQFFKQLLLNNHFQLLNLKLHLEHQVQHPALQVDTQTFKLKQKYKPKSLFKLKGKEKTPTNKKNEMSLWL